MTQDDWKYLKKLHLVRAQKVDMLVIAGRKQDTLRQVALMEQIDNIDIDINIIMKGVLIKCES